MSKLPYLVAEVNAALEVYLSGRTGQQYNRTSFILCDDCTELANKLFLLRNNRNWSDSRAGGGFKNFREVCREVRAFFTANRVADLNNANQLLNRFQGRRDRRNKFFHSTDLLDLNLHPRDCVEAFCDLLDYCKLLFGAEWDREVSATSSMETCEAIVRVDKKANSDPSIGPQLNAVLGSLKCHGPKAKSKGCEIAHHAEDLHLRLAIRNGGNTLRDQIRRLL